MGAAQSNSVTQMAQLVNDTVNQTVNQTSNLTTQNCVSNQTIKINVCTVPQCGQTPPPNCPTTGNDFQNSGSQSCTLNSSSMSQLAANFSTALSNTVSQSVEQSQDLVMGWLSTSFGLQQQDIKSTQDVANHITNIVKNIDFSSALLNMTSTQAQELNVCGPLVNNKLSNNVQQNALVSNVTNLVMNALANDSIYNDLSQYAKQQTSGKFEGLSFGVWGLIGGLLLLAILAYWFYHRRHSPMAKPAPRYIEMQPMGASAPKPVPSVKPTTPVPASAAA